MELRNIKSNTNWQEASSSINSNSDKIAIAIKQLENSTYKNKGYFSSLEALTSAIPAPSAGSKAYVGTSAPYAIYVAQNNTWVDSGYTGGEEEFNVGELQTEIELLKDGQGDLQSAVKSINILYGDESNVVIEENNFNGTKTRTIPSATHFSAGVMSASDKAKLDEMKEWFASLDGADSEAILEKWNEIVAFIEGLDDGETIESILSSLQESVDALRLDIENGNVVAANSLLSTSALVANVANRIGTSSVGSETRPIFINNGTPQQCSYTLGTSVPSDAEFTDTRYNTANASSNGLMTSSMVQKLDRLKEYDVATTSVNGLMSSSDKVALDNAVNNIEANGTTITVKYVNNSSSTFTTQDTTYEGMSSVEANTGTSQENRLISPLILNTRIKGLIQDFKETLNNFTGATSSTMGASGFVPAPNSANTEHFLKGDGSWSELPIVSTSKNGILTSDDKKKLDEVVAWVESIGGEGTDGIINKWDEIVEFLTNISDEDTLQGLLDAIEEKIGALSDDIKDGTVVAKEAENADVADKLGTETVGSSTRPIYLNSGVATTCSYTLGTSFTTTDKSNIDSAVAYGAKDLVLDGGVLTIETIGGSKTKSSYQPTTYEAMSQEEASQGENSTSKVVSAKVLHDTIDEMVTDALPDVMEGAKNSTSGKAGLVPDQPADANTKFLRGDGTWADTPQPSYATTSSTGVVSIDSTTLDVSSTGNISVRSNSHRHTIANITNLQTELDSKATTEEVGDIKQTLSSVNAKANSALTEATTTLPNKLTSGDLVVAEAEQAAKLGSTSIGSDAVPIYLVEGVPTESKYSLSVMQSQINSIVGTSVATTTSNGLMSTAHVISLNDLESTVDDILDGTTAVSKATNATNDANGNNIGSTYAKTSDVSSSISSSISNLTSRITNGSVVAGKATSATNATNDSNGSSIVSTYAKKAEVTALSTSAQTWVNDLKEDIEDGTIVAKKASTLGSTSIGSATRPIYLNSGTATQCSYTLGTSVPSNAKFTDTTYVAATTTNNGLMTSAMVTKLDGIATGANKYVLPVATSSVLGGIKSGRDIIIDSSGYVDITYESMPEASTSSAGAVRIGNNISISSGAISITSSNVTSALGYTPPMQDTTYGTATTSTDGLMSSTDKSKLDGIANSANNYTLPVATSTILGGVKSGGDITINSSGIVEVNNNSHTHTIANVTNLQTTLDGKASTALATASADGLMSSALFSKLSTIENSANYYTLPNATASVLGGVKIGSNITNSSGTISLTKANVTAALGYTPPTTNTTYNVVSSAANGLAPKIGTAASATIGTQSTEWVLATTSGETPTWRKLPSNAFTDTNNKVTQTLESTANAAYPILLAPSGQTATTTTNAYFDNAITVNPSTNTITANLSGTATNATNAKNATNDSNGSSIVDTYAQKTYVNDSIQTLSTAVQSLVSTLESNIESGSVVAGQATKLGSTNVGSNTTPMYLSSGVPKASSYNLSNMQTEIDSKAGTSVATTTSKGLMSSTDKSKLDSIESSANYYILPTAGTTLGGVKSGGDVTISSGVITVNDDSHNHVVSNVDGLQSTLDSISSKANSAYTISNETLPNNLTSGTLKVAKAVNADTLGSTSVGSNAKPIYLDSSGKAVESTYSLSSMQSQIDSKASTALAGSSTAGLMSASDKEKLDGIEPRANKYVLPSAGSSPGGVKSGGDVTIDNGIITVNDDSHNHVISNIDNLQTTLDSKAGTSITDAINTELEGIKDGTIMVGSASYADELTGRLVTTEEEIGFRPTGDISIGDGDASIHRIKGKSVVWNQISKKSRQSAFSTVSTLKAYDGVEYKSQSEPSHTYLFRARVTYTLADNSQPSLDVTYSVGQTTGSFNERLGLVTTGDLFSIIHKPSKDTYNVLNYFIMGTPDEGATCIMSDIEIHDLTLMFGAGNEPTSVEEFERRKPLNVSNAFNEGEIISFNGNALKSVGFNAWDEEWEVGSLSADGELVVSTTCFRTKNYVKVIPDSQYYIRVATDEVLGLRLYDEDKTFVSKVVVGRPTSVTIPSNCHYLKFVCTSSSTYNNDICIHLAHTGYRNGEYQPYEEDTLVLPNIGEIKDSEGNQLFPYGLLSAGSVHDEITPTKAIKRVGVVDMGTLDWGYRETGRLFAFASKDTALPKTSTTLANALCQKYAEQITPSTYNSGEKEGFGISYDGYVIVRDFSYTDAASFKAAMSGVMLYYELAEPIEVDLVDGADIVYEAWDFGTEELISNTTTTPMYADIVYAKFNAVDRIRENSEKIKAITNDYATKEEVSEYDKAVKSVDFYADEDSAWIEENNFDETRVKTLPNASASRAGVITAEKFSQINKEAYLEWGGKIIQGNVSPLDAAMSARHSANRLALANADGITIEYSTDGGATYIDYGATNVQKVRLVSGLGQSFYLGKGETISADNTLRVTLNAANINVYCQAKKLLINVTDNLIDGGTNRLRVKMETATKGDPTTFSEYLDSSLDGNSGWNSLPLDFRFGGGASQTSYIGVIRLTFYVTSISSEQTRIPTINHLVLLAPQAWTFPSNMASNGHLYDYDASQNATFPNKITAQGFVGNLSGTASKATSDANGSSITSTYAKKTELTTSTTAVLSSAQSLIDDLEEKIVDGSVIVGKAEKLSAGAGTNSSPIYISSSGVPTATTYNLATMQAQIDSKASTATVVNGGASGLMSGTDKKNLDTIQAWYSGAVGSDSNSAIDKWEEIVAFLDNIPEGDTLDGLITAVDTKVTTLESNIKSGSVVAGKATSATNATNDSNGSSIVSTYAKKAEVTALSSSAQTWVNDLKEDIKDGTIVAEKASTLGSTSIGSATRPIYLNSGTATQCSYTLGTSVPSNAKFTDTTYVAATTTNNGLMTSAMVTKLNGIATGANKYVLPVATSSVLGGVKSGGDILIDSSGYVSVTYESMPEASTSSAGVVKIGDNISFSSGAISITSSNVTSALGYTPPMNSNATTTANGLMSSTDKTNLNDAIKSLSVSGRVITYTKVDGDTGTITTQDTNTTYSNATASSNGLMSSAMYSKVNTNSSNIATNTSAISLLNNWKDSILSSTITSAVSTSVVALSGIGVMRIQVVSSLPSDASDHPNVLYIIKE